MTALDIIILTVMTAAAAWTVMTRSLLKATIGLALTSAIMVFMMFRLNSPLAAVFELSVCTGLVTAVFISTISLVRPLTHKEIIALSKDRIKRFWYLPVIMAVAGIALVSLNIPAVLILPAETGKVGVAVTDAAFVSGADVRNILWNTRQLDIFGQIIILLAGVFGTVLLFKEGSKK